MPTDTFTNLREDKKRIIFTAAVEEFSVRRFSEASINQIIKNARIPRGSFYQYFAGKEDLYLYVFSEIGKEKQQIIQQEELSADSDFFETYIHYVKTLLEWSKRKPDYHRIGMLMEMDDSEFITKLKDAASGIYAKMKILIESDKNRGLIKPDTDPDLIINLINILNLHMAKEFFQTGSVEDMMKQVSDMVNVIREGIGTIGK